MAIKQHPFWARPCMAAHFCCASTHIGSFEEPKARGRGHRGRGEKLHRTQRRQPQKLRLASLCTSFSGFTHGAGMGKLVTRTKSQRLEVAGRPCPDRPLLASTFLDYHRVLEKSGCVEDDQDRNRRKPCLHCSCAACGCRGNGQTEGQSKRN